MRVMISCGEASGDLYAGALIDGLRTIDPAVEVFGFGGPRMAAAGARLTGDFRGFSVTGLVEALAVVPKSWRMLGKLTAAAERKRPDVFVAIDFPDFNLRLLPRIRRLGVPIVYYISPQLWAWRASRIETIRAHVDRMLVIFPFEEPLYREAGVPVEFVGHPLVNLAVARRSRETLLAAYGLDASRPLIAFLPGSRPNELHQILPTLADAGNLIAEGLPDVQFMVARAPGLDTQLFEPLNALRRTGRHLAVVESAADDVLAAADVVVTASGTATVQAALHDRPMVIVYRVAPLTYALGKRFVRVNTYGMVNLVAGRPIVRELIQDALTPKSVADEAVSLLSDPLRVAAMRRDLAEVRARLGGPGASIRAARAVISAATADQTVEMPRAVSSLLIAVACLSRPLLATVVVPAEFKEIVADAALIARGHVTDVRGVVVPNLGIETVATIAIDRVIKGTSDAFVSMRVPGGVVGRYRWVMVGAPVVTVGEQAVFFLKRDPEGNGWRPVGLGMGIYAIHASPATRAPVIDPPVVAGRTAAAGRVVRGDPLRKPMAVSEFESLVRAVASSRTTDAGARRRP